MIKTQTQIEIR